MQGMHKIGELQLLFNIQHNETQHSNIQHNNTQHEEAMKNYTA
jgi:hypothetical protein